MYVIIFDHLPTSYDSELRSLFVQNLKTKMAEYGSKVIYFASPPNNLALIELLSEAFPGQFFYLNDLYKFTNETLRAGYLDNNYLGSLLEQEICFMSKYFLGAPLSSWTQSVLVDRIAREDYNHESILDVISTGAPAPPPPGYPPLIFQFPEGDFQYEMQKSEKEL